MMLVLSVFGQQAPITTPAQGPRLIKKGQAINIKPAIAAPVSQETPAAASVATVAPAQTSAPAKIGKTATVKPAVAASVSSETPVAASVATVAPAAQATAVVDVDTAQIAPTPAAQATVTPAVQSTSPAKVNIASPSPAPAASSYGSQQSSGTGGRAATVNTASEPRIATGQGSSSGFAGQQGSVATTAPTPRTPDYIEEKGFKGKVFEVKYRTPESLANALSALGSGFKGATIRANDEYKTVTVRDFPENIAAIEEAIKRLDTPQPVRPDLEFRIQVLIASNAASQGDEYPSDLNEVVKQLQSTFKYKNYGLMLTSTHRTKEGGNGVYNNGVAESKLFNVVIPAGNQIFYEYGILQISVDNSTTAGTTVQLGTFNFGLRIPLILGGSTDPKIQYQNVGFRSPVSLREGEKVVVGTTTMGDKGLIVVLTAKVNK